ncbi:pentatricopeptide repeat (PPR) superfamily protein, partial [Striga asiatica]
MEPNRTPLFINPQEVSHNRSRTRISEHVGEAPQPIGDQQLFLALVPSPSHLPLNLQSETNVMDIGEDSSQLLDNKIETLMVKSQKRKGWKRKSKEINGESSTPTLPTSKPDDIITRGRKRNAATLGGIQIHRSTRYLGLPLGIGREVYWVSELIDDDGWHWNREK